MDKIKNKVKYNMTRIYILNLISIFKMLFNQLLKNLKLQNLCIKILPCLLKNLYSNRLLNKKIKKNKLKLNLLGHINFLMMLRKVDHIKYFKQLIHQEIISL